MQKIFIIEHLEPELWPWCIIEYKHISKIVGKNNLWFTNIKNPKDRKNLEKYGKSYSESVRNLKLDKACILDPEASISLTGKIAEEYDYFIFGGILGDYPPRKRTKEELTSLMGNPHAYNIGKDQMSTDNAVYAVKQIANGTDIGRMKFKKKIEIRINKIESTILPYKYVLVNNKPLISRELISYLKKSNSE